MIAAAEANSNNWKYIEYKTDAQSIQMLNQIIPVEVIEKLK